MSKRPRRNIDTFTPQVSPVASAVRRQIIATAMIGTAIALPANAQDAVLEEIIVTATKRAENLQDVPISVTALGSDTIEELGLTNFEALRCFQRFRSRV